MNDATRIRIGSWIATPALNVLEHGGRSIRLEPRTMDVLVQLAARAGEVVSLEELLASVWKGVVVTDAAVYNTIKQLRQALAGSGDDVPYIETIPKRGYRLVAAVERLRPAPVVTIPSTSAPAGAVDPRRAEASPRRGLAPWLGATLALGLLLGVAATAIWLRGGGDPDSRDGASAPAVRFAIPVDGGVFGLAISPDGRYLAYATGAAPESGTLRVRPLDALVTRELPGTEGAMLPFWSPRSEEIGFIAQGRVKRLALAGGSPQDVARTAVLTAGSWNADDVILFDGSTGIERVPAAGGQATRASTLDGARGEVAHGLPWFLPDGRHFLFVSAFGSPGVHVGSLDSTERKQVLPFSAASSYAAGHLLFNRGDTLYAQHFDPDTLMLRGEPVRLADGLATDPTGNLAIYSASDAVLAYVTGDRPVDQPTPRSSRLAWYDRSGRRLAILGEPGTYRGIELSPDGTRIAVHRHEGSGGGNLWLYDLARGTLSRFTFGSGHDVWPVWSPGGDRLIFTGANFRMLEKQANGVGDETLVLDSERFAFASDWMNDGKAILITHQPATDNDVSALSLDGKPVVSAMLRTQFNEVGAVVSPSGRWLAYASDESGRFEVYVRPYPGLGEKLQLSTGGGLLPRWSPQGRELFYLTEQGALMSVQVGADAALSAGVPRELFRADFVLLDHWSPTGQLWHMPYDVSPDGQRFLVNEFVDDEPPGSPRQPQSTIVVVPNWAATLAAPAP